VRTAYDKLIKMKDLYKYEIIIQSTGDTIYSRLPILYENNKITYVGLFTQYQRDEIDKELELLKGISCDDIEIDKDVKQIFITIE